MGIGASIGVSVREGVSVGRGVEVSVSVGMWVMVSVKEMLVDVESCSGDVKAGVPPVLPGLQAKVDNIKMMGRMYFEFFMV